ncbi:hypothetical protein HPB50_004607 [Hyalomma asiaticum]|uniref:Uncharacterized protein n=1 Tax=Hyalomma asiaticum TaxID=266040 RepID=A0ACB7TCR5_HYAAI|nr:hypothetical protein HPB50_004607 [Hyalomma asiaticum]
MDLLLPALDLYPGSQGCDWTRLMFVRASLPAPRNGSPFLRTASLSAAGAHFVSASVNAGLCANGAHSYAAVQTRRLPLRSRLRCRRTPRRCQGFVTAANEPTRSYILVEEDGKAPLLLKPLPTGLILETRRGRQVLARKIRCRVQFKTVSETIRRPGRCSPRGGSVSASGARLHSSLSFTLTGCALKDRLREQNDSPRATRSARL